MTIQRHASRIAYRNPWMTVREDDITRPDGSAGLFGVVEKDDFAMVIPLDSDRVHLVEQERYPVGGRYWEFPQGSWDVGQAGDAEALARAELAEETGLRAGSLRHLGFLYEAYGYCDQGFDIYVAEHLEQGEPQRSVTEQDMRSRAFEIAEFERMILDGEIRDAPTVAAWGMYRLSERARSG